MTDPQLPARLTALITGASSGIGLDLAWIFAERGYNTILVARRLDLLEQLARELMAKHAITATPLAADLVAPNASQALYDTVTTRGLSIDVLINNAGFGALGRFDQTDLATQLGMIQVNIAALTALTRLFLPQMIARNRGRIMNIASTAAFQPGPLMAVYYASKAYVLSFTEAVAEELRHTNVTLTALCPGPTRTSFADVAHMQKTRLFHSPLAMSSRAVAQLGYNALITGKRVAIPGATNRLGAFLAHHAPRRLSTIIARRLQESP